MSYVNAPTQAPAGGAVSPLNGEFYKGGQFMCNQFAMPKGYTKHLRQAVSKRGKNTGNIACITVKASSVLIRMAGDNRADWVFSGTHEQCMEFARQLLAAKEAQARSAGVMPHPTELVVA